MAQCEYESPHFRTTHPPFGRSPDEDRNRCWVKDTRVFTLPNGQKKRFCILHAPPDLDDSIWPLATRLTEQAHRLNELIDDWVDENRKRFETKETPTDFALPGIRAGWLLVAGQVPLGQLILPGCFIQGPLHFNDAKIASIDLSNAHIHGAFIAQHLSVQATTTLTHAQFDGTTMIYYSALAFLYLDNTTFGKEVRINETDIGDLLINNPTFNGRAMIESSQIASTFYLSHAGERLKFGAVRFSSGRFYKGEPSQTQRFSDTDCSLLTFVGCDLSTVDLTVSDVRETQFESCEWAHDPNGKPYSKVARHDDILKTNNLRLMRLLRAHYRMLKRNFEGALDYQQAGHFHYREMQVLRRVLRLENKEKWNGIDRFFLWLYETVADYGESYKKLLASLILAFPFFGGVISLSEAWHSYCKDGSWSNAFAKAPGIFSDAIFGVLPTALQKHISFNGLWWLSKLLIVGEAITVATLGTLFVMAIRRRFRR